MKKYFFFLIASVILVSINVFGISFDEYNLRVKAVFVPALKQLKAQERAFVEILNVYNLEKKELPELLKNENNLDMEIKKYSLEVAQFNSDPYRASSELVASFEKRTQDITHLKKVLENIASELKDLRESVENEEFGAGLNDFGKAISTYIAGNERKMTAKNYKMATESLILITRYENKLNNLRSQVSNYLEQISKQIKRAYWGINEYYNNA